jgi:hypothetical protein
VKTQTNKIFVRQNIFFFLVLSVTLLSRSEYEIVCNDYDPDKALQLCAAKNFLEGKNISRCEADPGDLSLDTYSKFASWPYGYPLMVSLASLLTGDLLRASILVDVGAVILLVVVSLELVSLLGVGRRGMIVILLFLAFTHAPFVYTTSSDLIALSFYMLAFWYSLRLLRDGEQHLLRWVLLGCFLFLPSFLRYAYYPLVVPIPLIALWMGWKTRRKSLTTGALMSIVTAGTLTAVQTIVMKWNTGQYTCFSNEERRLFLRHLLYMAPFPIKALFLPRPFGKLLDTILGASWLLNPALIVGSCLLLGIISLRMMKDRVWVFSCEDRDLAWKAFVMIGGLTLLLNVTMLMFLSVTNAPQTDCTSFWTPVQETRYYAPSMFFIMLFFFVSALTDNRVRGAGVLVICALLISSVFGSYRLVNMYVLNRTMDSFQYNNGVRLTIAGIVRDMIDDTGERVVYADRDVVTPRLIQLHGGRTIRHLDEVVGGELPHTGPLKLVLRLDHNDVETHGSWLDRRHAQVVENLGETVLYRIDLE